VINKVKLAVADYLQANPSKTAKDVTIACFGLAFKPDIDDLRESPALAITRQIAAAHPGPVWTVEPNIDALPAALTELFSLASTEVALNQADIKVLLVDHKQFREHLPVGSVLDFKGIWVNRN